MERIISAKIAYCREQLDQYANKPGSNNKEQWMYWLGCLRTWEEVQKLVADDSRVNA